MTDTITKPKLAGQLTLAADEDHWRNNAAMIADVMELYCKPGMVILDATYGLGVFWKDCDLNPELFIRHDIDKRPIAKGGAAGDGVSFLDLPEPDNSIDIAILDPEYVARGGRKTSTLDDGVKGGKGMIARYGMDHAPKTPEALWTVYAAGIDECTRVLKPGGLLMCKLQNYISSATLQPVVVWALQTFADAGLELYDWATLVGNAGPQPSTNPNGSKREQFHLRQNHSHLMIGRKPKPRRKAKA